MKILLIIRDTMSFKIVVMWLTTLCTVVGGYRCLEECSAYRCRICEGF